MEGKLSKEDVPLLTEILAPHASKWRLIGGQLGFSSDELDAIQTKVPQSDHPYGCLSTMLEEWVQWPVGGHIHGASIDSLERTLKTQTVRLGAVADGLRKRLEEVRPKVPKNVAPLASAAAASPDSKLEVVDTTADSQYALPTIALKNISAAERAQLEARLCGESNKMMLKFQDLFSSIFKSFKQRNVPLTDIVHELVGFSQLKPIYKDSSLPAFRKQFKCLKAAKSVDDIMFIVIEYCSFFNYQMVARLISELGTDKDKQTLQDYEDAFAEYAKRKVFEMPSEVLPTSDNCQALVYMTLDDSFDDCTLHQLRLFQSKLCDILGVPKTTLQLCYIKSGSLHLTFQVSSFAELPVFPLSHDQEAALVELGVVNLSFSFAYKFNLQQEKQGSEYRVFPQDLAGYQHLEYSLCIEDKPRNPSIPLSQIGGELEQREEEIDGLKKKPLDEAPQYTDSLRQEHMRVVEVHIRSIRDLEDIILRVTNGEVDEVQDLLGELESLHDKMITVQATSSSFSADFYQTGGTLHDNHKLFYHDTYPDEAHTDQAKVDEYNLSQHLPYLHYKIEDEATDVKATPKSPIYEDYLFLEEEVGELLLVDVFHFCRTA